MIEMVNPCTQPFPVISMVGTPFHVVFQNLYKDIIAATMLLEYTQSTSHHALLLASHYILDEAKGKSMLTEEIVLAVARASVLISSKMLEFNLKFRGKSYLQYVRCMKLSNLNSTPRET